jgi:hypothetical protein
MEASAVPPGSGWVQTSTASSLPGTTTPSKDETMGLEPLTEPYATTRATLQRVATHVLARRRAARCGRFGLRATPGGIGTPACGPEHEVVRISGTRLIREISGEANATTSLELDGATLAAAAEFAGVDLSESFEAGHDTPAPGDPHQRLSVDDVAARHLFRWFDLGWHVIDATLGSLGDEAAPTVVQLWPEHFDVGCDVAVSTDRRANLGASPGDSSSSEPYLYVGPWDDARPGDPAYWNAPFGAVLGYAALRAAANPQELGSAFLRRGLDLLASAPQETGAGSR